MPGNIRSLVSHFRKFYFLALRRVLETQHPCSQVSRPDECGAAESELDLFSSGSDNDWGDWKRKKRSVMSRAKRNAAFVDLINGDCSETWMWLMPLKVGHLQPCQEQSRFRLTTRRQWLMLIRLSIDSIVQLYRILNSSKFRANWLFNWTYSQDGFPNLTGQVFWIVWSKRVKKYKIRNNIVHWKSVCWLSEVCWCCRRP